MKSLRHLLKGRDMNAPVATPSVARTPDGIEYTDDYLVYGDDVEVRIMEITPESARNFLKVNDYNRNIKQRSVRQLTEAMEEDHWMFNGDPIRIDVNGRLIDGQHRLLACVESERPFTALVITGLPPGVQDTIDIGKKRSVADALTMAGHANATVLAGGLVLLNGWVRWGVINRGSGRSVLTPRAALDLIARYPDFPDAARRFKVSRLTRLSAPSGWIAAGYIISRIDQEESEMFFHGVETGESLAQGDPRLTLRRRFEKERERPGINSTVSQAGQVWMIFRAWEAFTAREEIKKIILPPSLSSADAWPELQGDDLRFSLSEEGA